MTAQEIQFLDCATVPNTQPNAAECGLLLFLILICNYYVILIPDTEWKAQQPPCVLVKQAAIKPCQTLLQGAMATPVIAHCRCFKAATVHIEIVPIKQFSDQGAQDLAPGSQFTNLH